MTTLSISLPEPMRKFVQQQVKAGSFSTTSEYIRSLLRGETERQRKVAALRQEVAIGIAQADRGETTELDMAAIKAKARKATGR